MKAMRKLMGVIMAMVCGLSAVVSVSASADEFGDPESDKIASMTTYDPCDVNHDGNVSIVDVICINRYLGGTEAVLHPSYLDANGNNIVDVADMQKILATLVELSYTWNFVDITSTSKASFSSVLPEEHTIGDMTELLADPTELANFTTNDISATRNYIRFKTYQPTTLSTYSLTTTYDSNSKDFPIRANSDYYTSVGESETGIVRLVRSSEHSSGSSYNTYHGTGFIIDDHRIVTAAHCIYHDYDHDKEADPNEFYSDLQIQMCNSNGELTSTVYNVKEIHIPSKFVTEYEPDYYPYDYALLTVNETLSSTTYTHYEIGTPVNVTSNAFNSINLFISGFPQDVNPNTRVYTSKGHGANNSSTITNMLEYVNHTWNGLSGSPVYTAIRYRIDNDEWIPVYTAVAIHTLGPIPGHEQQGPAINEFLLTFYHQGSSNVGY